MDNRNVNLPRGPKADALGTLLMFLYMDVVAGKVAPRREGALSVIESWRGIELVHITAYRGESIEVSFFLDGGEGGVTVQTNMAPAWVADRIRMIWTELGTGDAIRALIMLER